MNNRIYDWIKSEATKGIVIECPVCGEWWGRIDHPDVDMWELWGNIEHANNCWADDFVYEHKKKEDVE